MRRTVSATSLFAVRRRPPARAVAAGPTAAGAGMRFPRSARGSGDHADQRTGAYLAGNRHHTLVRNPNNGHFGLHFDESSTYYIATNNVFSNTGRWATANYGGGENIGNRTVTNNWTANGNGGASQRWTSR
jgi:hypothetical protein